MEISFRSLSSSPVCSPALFRRRCRAPPARHSGPAAGQLQLRLRFTWHLHKPLEPHSPRAGAPSLRHAAQNHLAAATATPPWPEPAAAPRTAISGARLSSRQDPSFRFPRPLALSLPRHPGTPPPLHRTPASLKPTVEPRLHSRSAQIDPTSSFASTPRSSPAPSLPPSTTGTPSPSSPLRHRPPAHVEPPLQSTSVPPKTLYRCAVVPSISLAPFPSPPATHAAGIRRSLPCSPSQTGPRASG